MQIKEHLRKCHEACWVRNPRPGHFAAACCLSRSPWWATGECLNCLSPKTIDSLRSEVVLGLSTVLKMCCCGRVIYVRCWLMKGLSYAGPSVLRSIRRFNGREGAVSNTPLCSETIRTRRSMNESISNGPLNIRIFIRICGFDEVHERL